MPTTLRFMTSELRHLLANAALFACADPAEPSLRVIRFEFIEAHDGHHLFIAAAGKDALSYEEARPADAYGSESFSLRLPDARQWLKSTPRHTVHREMQTIVWFEPDDNLITFMHNDVSTALRFAAEAGAFPDVRREIERPLTGSKSTAAFGLRYLALLDRVETGARGARPLTARFEFSAGTDEPVRVSVGETFRAMLMPAQNAG
jgi:hypothetical protein